MDRSAKLIQVAREILLPLLILVAFATTAGLVRLAWTTIAHAGPQQAAATPPAMESDPHSRLLLENAQVRVFALTLPRGQENMVWHEHSFLTVTLADSEIIRWKNGESPVQHFRAPQGEIHFYLGRSAHGSRNDSNTEYRNVTVEFLDPGVTNYGYRYDTGGWDYGPAVINPPVDPEAHFVNSLNLEKAEARDVQLLPKESLPASKRPALLIAITPLGLTAGTGRKISLSPGEVVWLKNPEISLVNSGARARFALVEFKPANSKY